MTATSRSGRVAEVRTDEGHHVTVIGTPVVPDPSGADRATSIDRTYEVGVRYEFDPRNSTSPYEDTACTSTHVLPPLHPPLPRRRAEVRSRSSTSHRRTRPRGLRVVCHATRVHDLGHAKRVRVTGRVMAFVGYARVSTRDQHPQAQADVLTSAGCEKVFIDHAS